MNIDCLHIYCDFIQDKTNRKEYGCRERHNFHWQKTCGFYVNNCSVKDVGFPFTLYLQDNTDILIGQFRPGKWSWFCQICIWLTTSIYKLRNVVMCCRIWSWSLMPCDKHGPRDSVGKNWGQRPGFLSLPRLTVFHTASETMKKSYYSMFTDYFFLVLFAKI